MPRQSQHEIGIWHLVMCKASLNRPPLPTPWQSSSLRSPLTTRNVLASGYTKSEPKLPGSRPSIGRILPMLAPVKGPTLKRLPLQKGLLNALQRGMFLKQLRERRCLDMGLLSCRWKKRLWKGFCKSWTAVYSSYNTRWIQEAYKERPSFGKTIETSKSARINS